MPTLPTEQLAELIRNKRLVLVQLHQVGVKQGELVSSGDVGALLKLLAAKQRLLAALKSVEEQLKPFRDEDPESRDWATPEHRAACSADAEACRQLLAEVMAMEREHERQMTERRDQVATQLQRAHAAHDASGAYQTHSRGPAPTTPLAQLDQPPAASLDLTSEA